jgi:hypothetical protein
VALWSFAYFRILDNLLSAERLEDEAHNATLRTLDAMFQHTFAAYPYRSVRRSRGPGTSGSAHHFPTPARATFASRCSPPAPALPNLHSARTLPGEFKGPLPFTPGYDLVGIRPSHARARWWPISA